MASIGIFVFSGTGNTYKCANLLQQELLQLREDVELHKIESGLETTTQVFDTIVISYPIHGFNTPENVINFCKHLPRSDKGSLFYVVKSSGEPLKLNNNSSSTIIKTLKKKGYLFSGEYHLVMPYNMIFKHTDEMASKMYCYVKKRMPLIAKEISEKVITKPKVPISAKIMSGLCKIEHWGMRFNGRLFKIKKDKCIKCMQCVKNCPMQNISFVNGKFKFGKHCIGCTRCSFNCPSDAFRFGILNFLKVNGKYDFSKNLDNAVIGKYCHKSYKEYFEKYK